MTSETIINVSENPHIVLGKGVFAVSQGVCVGSLSNGEPESVYGVLSFSSTECATRHQCIG